MKRTWIRNIIGGLSLTSAMFVFQACYGTPQDFGLDVLIEGQVKSETTGFPIEGIKVSVGDDMQYTMTNDSGRFSFYTTRMDTILVQIEDVDSLENGSYLNKDTVLNNLPDWIFLEINLEER